MLAEEYNRMSDIEELYRCVFNFPHMTIWSSNDVFNAISADPVIGGFIKGARTLLRKYILRDS